MILYEILLAAIDVCAKKKSAALTKRCCGRIFYTDLCEMLKSFFQLLVERCLFLCGPHSLLRSSLSAQP